MAELSAAETMTDSCCAPEAQASCCEPDAKAECCGSGHGDGCGCAATSKRTDVREQVRERHAAAVQVTTTDRGPST